ncbi:MAG: hypothetical protein JNJ43_15290 [Anaerolineales bacterium]|nr:hypothetical protein [Anaerolineales bacterium]
MAKKDKKDKKEKEQTNSGTDVKTVLRWSYVVGILVASIAGAIGFKNDVLSIVLAVIGLLAGLFYFDSADLMNFGLRYLIVVAAASSLNVLPVVGAYITGFFTAFAAFLGPVVLGMVIMYFWNKYFGNT